MKSFYLVGHSIGAYISTYYFDRYNQKVKKLILISPAGFNEADEEYFKKLEKRKEKMSWFFRTTVVWMGNKILKDKVSPFSYAIFPNFFISKYLGNPRFKFTEKEKVKIQIIMGYFIKQKQYSERCLGHFLVYGQKSYEPLVKILSKHQTRFKDIQV